MKLSPSNVRSQLTLWYVGVLAALLVAYGLGSLFFLHLNMREQLDHNLLEDMETVEGQIATEPDGSLTLRLHHGDEGDAGFDRFVEIWSPEGKVLYRTPQLEGQALGGPPSQEEAKEDVAPVSEHAQAAHTIWATAPSFCGWPTTKKKCGESFVSSPLYCSLDFLLEYCLPVSEVTPWLAKRWPRSMR